jgi:hypothetical protein
MRRSLITVSRRKVVITLFLAGFLGGCATAAQRQYQAMATGNQALIAQGKSCLTEAYNSAEGALVRSHLPIDAGEITLAQLSDQSLPTRQEVAAVLALHPRIQACRKALLDGLLGTMPSVVPILAKEFAGADDDTIAFVQRKMSWGERVRRARDRYLALQAELQTQERQIVAGLERSHEAELARRQAALDAMARWAQTQQMINAMNRPVFTNCTGTGSMINCISN